MVDRRLSLVLAALAAGVTAAIAPRPIDAWGHLAHGMVQDRALALLPAGPLKRFMELNQKAIETKTRALDCSPRNPKDEVKHRIDLDAEGYIPPINTTFEKVIEKLGEEKAVARGRLPWAVVDAFEDTKRALRGHDLNEAEDTLVLLGHLVADTTAFANVTVERDEKGDHAGFASLIQDRLIVANAKAINTAVTGPRPGIVIEGRGEIIPDVLDFAWKRVIESHRDYAVLRNGDPGKKSKTRDKDLWIAVEKRIEQRLAEASYFIAQIWYVAWKRAGEPALEPSTWKAEAPAVPDAPETAPVTTPTAPALPAPVATPTTPEKPRVAAPPTPECLRANETAKKIGLVFRDDDDQPGATIASVVAGSVAALAGVQAGDVVVDLDGTSVRSPGDVVRPLLAHGAGSTAVVSLLRAGVPNTFKLRVPR